MGASTSRVGGKVLAFSFAAAGLLIAIFGPVGAVHGQDKTQNPSAELLALNFKFEGATGCNAAKCHGAPTPGQPPKPAGNEFVTWKQGKPGGEPDKHSLAYKTLAKPESIEMAKKLNIPGKPEASALCTNCHALPAPADKQMAKFDIREGVTCGACHGPYEKWDKPHNQPGGCDGLRKQVGYKELEAAAMTYSTSSPEHKKMLTEFGLFDTRPILARAEKCTSCHLAIDAKLVEAGHPQPIFELAYYTEIEPPHWREPGGYWGTKVWAAGQVICLRDAMTQLADRAAAGAAQKLVDDAYAQAMGHLGLLKHLAGGPAAAALAADETALKAAAKNNAALATAAKAAAGTASKMMAGIASLKPADANTAGTLTRIAADATVVTTAGFRGAQQQSLAIATLVSAYKKGKGNVAGIDNVETMVGDKLLAVVGDEAAFKPAEFTTNLAAVKSAIMLMIPSGAGVPDPIDIK